MVGTWRAVLRPAVTRQVEGHHVELWKERGETVEARRVVEPTVEGKHRPAIDRTPLAGGEAKVRNLEVDLATAHRWSL
jgi:hypothetical protein